MEQVNCLEFECPIWNSSTLSNPVKSLVCGHSFCSLCIEKHCKAPGKNK